MNLTQIKLSNNSVGGALVFLVPTPLDLLGLLVPSGFSGAHRRGPVG